MVVAFLNLVELVLPGQSRSTSVLLNRRQPGTGRNGRSSSMEDTEKIRSSDQRKGWSTKRCTKGHGPYERKGENSTRNGKKSKIMFIVKESFKD